MSVDRALRRLADSLAAANRQGTLRAVTGTVSSVDAGGGTDGADLVHVTVGSDTLPASHLKDTGWTPTAGDLVLVLLANSTPIILGHLVGLPDYS